MKWGGKEVSPDDGVELAWRALATGCAPEWSDGMFGFAWRCGCADNAHGCDQQCSDLTEESVAREEKRLLEAVHDS